MSSNQPNTHLSLGQKSDKGLYRMFVKRPLDILASGSLLIFLSPVFLGIAIWVKKDSKGPVFFRQTRVGKNGVHFTILKFRSMRVDAPNVATAEFENPETYITKSGRQLRKMSLDELPQLLNVFRGEMSFIGPRPLIPEEKTTLTLRHNNGAEQVLPGITGLAQVSGRDEVSDEEKARYDGQYAQQITFLRDVRILLKTASDVLVHRGVHEGKQERAK